MLVVTVITILFTVVFTMHAYNYGHVFVLGELKVKGNIIGHVNRAPH